MPGEFQEQRPTFIIRDPRHLAENLVGAFNQIRALDARDSDSVLGPTPADITASKTSTPSLFRTIAESRCVQVAAGATVGIGGFFGLRSVTEASTRNFTRTNGEQWVLGIEHDRVYPSGRPSSVLKIQVNGGSSNDLFVNEGTHAPLGEFSRIVIEDVTGNPQTDKLTYTGGVVDGDNTNRIDLVRKSLSNLNEDEKLDSSCIDRGMGGRVISLDDNTSGTGVVVHIKQSLDPNKNGKFESTGSSCVQLTNDNIATSTPTEVISTFTPTAVTTTATPTPTPGAVVKGAVCKKGPKAENASVVRSDTNPNEYTTNVNLVFEPACTPKQTTLQVLREQRDDRGRRVNVVVFEKTFFGEAARSAKVPYEITQSGKYQSRVVSETEEGKLKKDVLTPFKLTRTLWKKALNHVEAFIQSPAKKEQSRPTFTATPTPATRKADAMQTPQPTRSLGR